MPKEQGNAWERVARSSSKTAKDKTNSATLQASQGGSRRDQSGMGDNNNRVQHIDSEKDSEKDSGYSGKPPVCELYGFWTENQFVSALRKLCGLFVMSLSIHYQLLSAIALTITYLARYTKPLVNVLNTNVFIF